MATKTHPLFSNFSSGEISPKLDGRIDLAQYFNGVQELKNWICVPQGGIKTRGGFHFVSETKASGVARLIPFCFSELQNYILLFGEQYIRFYMNNGIICNPIPTPYEIASPYTVANDLWSIRFAQDDENLYLVHPLYPPMVLQKGVGHTNFTIDEMDFIDGPYEDEIDTPTITPSDVTGNITLTAASDLFLPGHVGAYWRLNHAGTWGYVIITGYTSATVVDATVMTTLGGAGATTSHMEGAWSDVNGWPRQICFDEGRMLFASNYEHPQTVWASKTAHYTDFTPGVLDNDAYNFTPADLNIIRWILPGRLLSIGALNSEATAEGPTDTAISATDPPKIKTATTHGSSDLVAPVRVGKAILFLQRASRKIREFVYTYVDDAYGAPDITIASEHLFDSDIIDIVFSQEPDALLWAIRNDVPGSILSCTYDRNIGAKGGIVAWARHYTDGRFESIASIPYQNQDQLWAVVNRTINGISKRYVEYYDPSISVDSGLTWSGAPVTVLSGLDHLVRKTVQIVGDGAVHPAQVVPITGEITISPAASSIYVGIGYTPSMITNRPETQGAPPNQGLKRRWNKIIARVLNTTGLTINGEVIPARIPADPMDSAPVPYSGDVNITNLGWDTEGRITVVQPLPLPAHLVSLTGTLVVGDD